MSDLLNLLQKHFDGLGFSTSINRNYLDIFPTVGSSGFIASIFVPPAELAKNPRFELQLPSRPVIYPIGDNEHSIMFDTIAYSIDHPTGLETIETKVIEHAKKLSKIKHEYLYDG